MRQRRPSGGAGWRPGAALALTLFAAAGPGAFRAVSAQQPRDPAPPPTFRTGTALVRVDAAVLDSRNHPVPGLRPDDFRVEIDGRPRRVLFAEAPAPSPGGAPASSSFVNTRRTGGRAVAVVVDLESVAPGAERPLLETAARFVEALPDTDPVILVPLPGASLPLTRDHRLAAARIRALRGASQAPSARHAFTFEEALAYERGDRRVIDTVIERECSREAAGRTAIGLTPLCPPELVRETRDRLFSERRHVELVLTNVIRVARMLRDLETPATLVLIAGGLGFDTASLARYQEAARDVSAAGIMMYSVHAATAEADASAAGLAQDAAMRDRHAGLANLATMSGGVFLEGIARGTGVFERMRAEIVESYTLGIEAAASDFDGRPHAIRVGTTRPGLTVRTRPLVLMPSPGGDPPALLARLMRQGLDVPDLPLALATQTVRGEEATTVKVDMRLDVGRGSAGQAPVRYAAAILGRNGEPLLETGGIAADAGAGAATARLTAQLAPGPYRLRVAAVDADRRAGALDVPFVAGLRTVAGLQASDVIVGGPTAAPALHVEAGASLEAALELTTAEVERFARAAVAFELHGDSLPAPVLVEASLQPTNFERQRIARAAVATEGLAPGEYTLSAILTADGVPAGRIPGHVVIVPPARAAAPAPARPADARDAGAAADGGAPSSDPRLRELLPMLGRYVDAYGEDTAAIVGLEKYIQYPDGRGKPLEILAELAMVRSGTTWLGYRDVFQVGGDRVPDRRDRLMRILETSSDPVTEAARITAENARFNVGPVTRNFNVPATALLFFTSANLRRFTFTWKGRGRIDGAEAVEIAFRETAVPTLIRTRAGVNVPASGSLWLAPADGAVLRTRLRLEHFADAVAMSDLRAPAVPPPQPAPPPPPPPPPPPAAPGPAPSPGGGQGGAPSAPAASPGGPASSGGYTAPSAPRPTASPFADQAFTELRSRAEIEVTFARHPNFRMWLPARMEEEYEGPLRRFNASPVQGLSRARATYSEYKRFESGARIIGIAK